MKQFILLFIWATCIPTYAQPLAWGDQGNGTYKNPVLNADYSDPDVIRVGEKYYMVASDFHFMGMQVLESDDMVNWQFASQVYSRLDYPGWDANQHYAGGAWAPSIRWHDGRFYIYFCTPDEGLFMTTATDAHGPWAPLHCVCQVKQWEDPCPLWDDDGRAYLGRSQHGAGPIIVHTMSADGRQLLDDGVVVYTGPVAEGTKWLKHGGWYYLIIPEGGRPTGGQTVLRAKSVYGPYEKRVVLEKGSTDVNGPHQGALVDTPQGQWWFYHFQQTPALGRVVHLQPARWRDDWPLIGVDIDGNGIGEPVAVWTKPDTKQPSAPSLPSTSDDFGRTTLGLQWQWCHNPDNSHWSLGQRPGWLTLEALPAKQLRECRNMLTQKTMGFRSQATTMVDCRKLKPGDFAGLLCMGRAFTALGIAKEGICLENQGQRTVLSPKKPTRIYLRLDFDGRTGHLQYSYSLDGKKYVPAGEGIDMVQGFWKGVRIGLFCYGSGGGKVHYDFLEYKVEE